MSEPTIYLLIAGLMGGFFAGFLGIGGGIIFITILPILLPAMGVPHSEVVEFTIANSIFATFFASAGANITQIIKKNFYIREVLIIGLTGSVVGLVVLQLLVYSSWYTPQMFGWVVIVLLFFIMFNTLRVAKKNQSFHDQGDSNPPWLFASGTLAGVVAAISGLGGGIVVIPILNSVLKMNIKKAQSISLGVIFISSLALSLKNMAASTTFQMEYSLGFILFPVLLPLVIGVLLASPIGVLAARRVPAYILSYIFAIFVFLLIGVKFFELYG